MPKHLPCSLDLPHSEIAFTKEDQKTKVVASGIKAHTASAKP